MALEYLGSQFKDHGLGFYDQIWTCKEITPAVES